MSVSQDIPPSKLLLSKLKRMGQSHVITRDTHASPSVGGRITTKIGVFGQAEFKDDNIIEVK